MKKKVKKYIIAFYHSISFRLFVVLVIIIIFLDGLYSILYYKLQNQIYEDTIGLAAYRTSDLAKKSLYRLMLLNERDELYNTIQLMGNEPGIESIAIYNKKGVVKFSTKETEIGHVVDMKAEACYLCHEANQPITSLPIQRKSRIYRAPDGRRMMGLINPILNAPGCSESVCHAHDSEQTVLGVFDVKMPLDELDQALLRTQIIVYTLSFGLIIFAMILLALVVYLIIYRPIRSLQTGMLKLAVGELDYRIEMERIDELGMLASSFNNMAQNLKGAYNRMMQIDKMASLGKMAATVAHELNNPLTGIASYAKLLQKKAQKQTQQGDDYQEFQKDLGLIFSESLRCGNIVRNLLEFAHGDSTKFQTIRLKDIVDKALGIVKHHMELARIQATTSIKIRPDQITCDPEQLLQAFVALMVNAVEAMQAGGRLKLIAQNSPDRNGFILIKISDTGHGIATDLQDKIFEPFFSTKADENGIGLGLSIVYGIIQRHHGKIWYESTNGIGTTFFIELPLMQSPKE